MFWRTIIGSETVSMEGSWDYHLLPNNLTATNSHRTVSSHGSVWWDKDNGPGTWCEEFHATPTESRIWKPMCWSCWGVDENPTCRSRMAPSQYRYLSTAWEILVVQLMFFSSLKKHTGWRTTAIWAPDVSRRFVTFFLWFGYSSCDVIWVCVSG